MTSSGQSHGRTEIKSYATTAISHAEIEVNPTNIFEYEAEEAHTLAMAFAQTYSLVKGIQKLEARENPQYMQKSNKCTTEAVSSRFTFKPMVLIFEDK
jgi:hypothetical protein